MEVAESQLVNLFHKPAASVENPVAVLQLHLAKGVENPSLEALRIEGVPEILLVLLRTS